MRPQGLVQAIVAVVVAVESSAHAVPQASDSGSVVTVTVMPGRTVARPGEVVPIAIVLDHQRGWHTQAARAGGASVDPDAVATAVVVTSGDPRVGVRSDATQWPVAHTIETRAMGAPSKASVYSDRAIVYVPIEIAPNAKAGNVAVPVSITFQACDDKTCLQPVTDRVFEIMVAIDPAAAAGGAYTYPELFAGFRPVSATMPATNDAAATTRFNIGLVVTGAAVVAIVIGMTAIAVLKKGGR